MGKYFGTDGFRGEANVNLTVEHAYKVGRFLGWYYGQAHKAQIVIGKDSRSDCVWCGCILTARNDNSKCFLRCSYRRI